MSKRWSSDLIISGSSATQAKYQRLWAAVVLWLHILLATICVVVVEIIIWGILIFANKNFMQKCGCWQFQLTIVFRISGSFFWFSISMIVCHSASESDFMKAISGPLTSFSGLKNVTLRNLQEGAEHADVSLLADGPVTFMEEASSGELCMNVHVYLWDLIL